MKLKLFIIILLGFIHLNVFGQAEKFKAGYIYQFTKYIEWPAAYKSGDFVIGVLGSSTVQGPLNDLAASKKVVDQKIRVESYGSVADIGKCHILYISESQSGNLSAVIGKLSGSNTLVVAEKAGLAQAGAGINFIEKDGKLVFEVNQSGFSNQGLNVNSQLVNLAVNKY